tara:strand:+ start:1734 stop:2177 length:444 start_codon:yes stop_codon:yes gene_type:complete
MKLTKATLKRIIKEEMEWQRGELPMGAFGSPEGEEDLEIAQEWREDAVKEIVRVLADLGLGTSDDEVEQALSRMGDVEEYIRRGMRTVSSEINKRSSSRHPLLRPPRRNRRGERVASGDLYFRPVDYMYRLMAVELGLVDESTAGLV